MKVLAIVNQKGGVGKTTTAVTLGHGLARLGRRVVLVDLDAQGNVADVLGLEKWGGIGSLLFGDLRAAMRETGRERLALVASDHTTVEAQARLFGESFREYRLANRLRMLDGFEVAILDAAPGVDVLQVGALVACTHFVVPVALDHLAMVGAADMLSSVASLQQAGAFGGRFLGVLPTMWERRTRESDVQLRSLVGQYEGLVWPPVPLDVKAREAPSFGKTLWEYAPGTRALQGVEVGGHVVGGYEQVMQRLVREMGV